MAKHGLDIDRIWYLDLVDEMEKLGYTEVKFSYKASLGLSLAIFENAVQFRKAVTKYAMVRGVALRLRPNDSQSVRVTYKKENCDWHLHASVDGNTKENGHNLTLVDMHRSHFLMLEYTPI